MYKKYTCPICGSPYITNLRNDKFKCNSCDTCFKYSKEVKQTLSTEEIYRKSIGSVLEICTIVDGEEQFGTGIVVSNKGHILTCAHLMSNTIEDQSKVKNFCDAIVAKNKTNEKIIKTELIFSDNKLDLALLYSEEAKKYPPIEISNIDIQTGEHICAIGNSKGEGLCVVDGIISDSFRTVGSNNYIVISAPVTSGYSGGPVFNANGCVVGIIKGGRDGAVAMNYAISSSCIKSFCKNYL